LGDALGSNVVNVALILGVALSISAFASPRASVRRDFPVALLVPVAVGALSLDGRLSRADGCALLAFFFSWLAVVVQAVRRERSAAPAVFGKVTHTRAIAESAGGLGLLIGSGHFIVQGARGIAASFGVSEFVIGATVVAIGTSIPELATAVISKLRGHDEIGLGTVLGSNIFNGLFIIGLAATICPIDVARAGAGLVLGFGVVSTLITFPRRDGLIPRSRGVILQILYLIYLTFILLG
jgi:cation:H+ antiporter